MTDTQTLHFLTCGHVDDGKSTLTGRLLFDIGVIPEDHIQGAMVNDEIDFSRLTDGLEDERTQGITIDVAYRFFRYRGRHFRLADTPGHIQYTQNMAVAAANSDCAVILVDAWHGVREQTVRHSRIAAFFGIRDFVIAVNKMDLVEYNETRFKEICDSYRHALGPIAASLKLTFIPLSARYADNLTEKSLRTPWYSGPTLIEYLATLQIEQLPALGARFPIQSVIRFNASRGYQGMLNGGSLAIGDQVHVAGTAKSIVVKALYHSGKEVQQALPGQAITLTTDTDIDLSRGNVLHAPQDPPLFSDHFQSDLLWLDPSFKEQKVMRCLLKIHNREEHVEVNTIAAGNPTCKATISTASPLAVDAYSRHRHTGLFILVDPESERTIGVGTVLEEKRAA